jgi:hypothetical protein
MRLSTVRPERWISCDPAMFPASVSSVNARRSSFACGPNSPHHIPKWMNSLNLQRARRNANW